MCYTIGAMVIQLTKTKSITIGGGGGSAGGAKKHRKYTNIVGIDMFNGDERGFPAVRILAKKNNYKVVATGFVPPPAPQLPASWEEASKPPQWTLPPQFQAAYAAFAITSPGAFVAQTSRDAVRSEIQNGAHKGEEAASPAAKAHKLGIRREVKKAEPAPAPAASATAPSKIDDSAIVPGVPISNGGIRFVMRELADSDGLVMEAGIPEFQALWLSRLLPEGKRPTVASVQPRLAAFTASILKDPEFVKAKGTGLALFLNKECVIIAGFKNYDLVMWRKCQSVPNAKVIREALIQGLGVDDSTLNDILNDTLIDPRPVLEGIISPLMDELIVSRDYLAAKLKMEIDTAFIVGLSVGLNHWNSIAQDHAQLTFTECKAFDGFEGELPEAKEAGDFTGALGAALALMAEEDE